MGCSKHETDDKSTSSDESASSLENSYRTKTKDENVFEIITSVPLTETEVLKEEAVRNSIHLYSKTRIKDLPDDLRRLFDGMYEELDGDHEVPDEEPDWLDVKKVKIGQAFSRKYYYAVNYADLLSLLVLFAPPNGLDPLIYTEKSHTPRLACERYLSTVLRVKSWYETEFWKPGEEGYNHIKAVRRLHSNVARELNGKDIVEIKKNVCLETKLGNGNLLCPLYEALHADFQAIESDSNAHSSRRCSYAILHKRHVYLSQLDMSLTQCGFFGLLLLHHKQLGALYATDEELEGYVHMWRYIGYLLGIKDEYNFCNGSVDEVKTRVANMMEYIVKPTLAQAGKEWEHMSRCAFQWVGQVIEGMSYETVLLHACHLLNIPVPTILSNVTKWHVMFYKLLIYVLGMVNKVPGLTAFLSYFYRTKIEMAFRDRHEMFRKFDRVELPSVQKGR